MKSHRFKTAVGAAVALVIIGGASMAYSASAGRPVVIGQTEGFANGKLAVFDYTQNFVCANDPLNAEECQVGAGSSSATNPAIDAGEQQLLDKLKLKPAETPDLLVIVPFFEVPGAGDAPGTLEALDTTPDVAVQCPEKQTSALNGGHSIGKFGHCVFHDAALDTSPLAGVTVNGVTFGGIIPLPNHSHIVKETPGGSVPWDASVVLVLDKNLWPDADGHCAGSPCLTSFDAVAKAPAGSIVGPVPTSLFLFFGVHNLGH
jgi:hypothetical protein